MDPLTIALIASAASAAAQGTGSFIGGRKAKRAQKEQDKATRKQTRKAFKEDALQRAAELETHGTQVRANKNKMKANQSMTTAELVREALKG